MSRKKLIDLVHEAGRNGKYGKEPIGLFPQHGGTLVELTIWEEAITN